MLEIVCKVSRDCAGGLDGAVHLHVWSLCHWEHLRRGPRAGVHPEGHRLDRRVA